MRRFLAWFDRLLPLGWWVLLVGGFVIHAPYPMALGAFLLILDALEGIRDDLRRQPKQVNVSYRIEGGSHAREVLKRATFRNGDD